MNLCSIRASKANVVKPCLADSTKVTFVIIANVLEPVLRQSVAFTQDIAARLIGHIRRASLGDALLPFDQRVDNALVKILKQKAWTPEQISWLERLANSLKEQVAIDDDTFKTGNYKRRGGKNKLEAVFYGELNQVLEQFNDYMWEQPAQEKALA